MKHLICMLLVFFTSETRSFDIFIEEFPDDADIGDHPKDFVHGEINHFGRNKRGASNEEDENEGLSQDSITLYSYKVESTITSRFVNTMIRSKVVNNSPNSQNLVFDIQIPKGAYINNFTMNVNGMIFSGSIKEKSVARSLYSQARARGKAAGLMRTNSFDMENFKAELNVPGGTKVQFEIHYQEVLRRKLGVYEHVLYIQPGRLAKHLEVDVYITEPQGIGFVHVPSTITEALSGLVQTSTGEKKAHVSFKPTLAEQRQCPNCSATAVDGNLVVKYDVKREASSELQVFNGYFLHFFAPENLPPLPKNILFVIDVSGSMWGLKMKQIFRCKPVVLNSASKSPNRSGFNDIPASAQVTMSVAESKTEAGISIKTDPLEDLDEALRTTVTIDAMKTILDDLRSDDQFSIIDFNHNIRCWKEELVYASSIETEDAKKYIQRIQPNGGTNINEAILRAIFILKEASDHGMLDPNSVSLIVLVSDGDPTVGELKLTKIQKNVKKNIRDDFSLHSLGIGFDVDYDFLERLAQENHGMAQRIYGNQNTAAQLKEFYKKVSTPLLKNVVLEYPTESVSDVTHNKFHNYFGGDEIVVAGKVDPKSVPILNSIVTAASANSDLIIETLTEVEALNEFFAESKHAFPDFAKQYWAQLTINQLLAERNLASSAASKRNITKKILQLSIDHHFVTPLTSLLIESESGNERMLADSPKDPKGGCCPTSLVLGTKIATDVTQATMSPVKRDPREQLKGPVASVIPIAENLSEDNGVTAVDSDPHFIINLPKSQTDVCFNIDTQPGNILNLLSDPELDVVINGQIVAAKQSKDDKINTFFGTFGMYFKKQNLKIEISTEKITLKDGSYSRIMSWAESSSLTRDSLAVSVKKNSNVTITVNEDLTFLIVLHRVWKNHPVNVDFLGIYIPPTNKFSPTVHGLIGQFMNEPEVSVYNVRAGPDPEKPIATMSVKGHKLTVTRGMQKEYQSNSVFGTDVRCWFVHNSGKGFIDGHYKDYIVPQLLSSFKRL